MKSKNPHRILLALLLIAAWPAMAQKKLTEATITYSISINTAGGSSEVAGLLDGAYSTVYLKSNASRTEMASALGTQSTIVDGKTNGATILKDYGAQKYMISMTQAQWTESNKKFDGISFTYTEEYKTIQGYNCQKAIGKMSNGKTFDVYFTKELLPINTDFLYINKNLPGLAMQYDASIGDLSATYTVSKIDFKPVPQAKFDIPTSGYRVLSYEESKRQ